MEKDKSVEDRLVARMKLNYMQEGMRINVEGILLIHEHNFPHVLLFEIGDTFYELPGGRLKPGETEIECLRRKLSSKLAATSPSLHPDWQIGECVGMWWKPNFEDVMYPYCPPHITKPKECKKTIRCSHARTRKFCCAKEREIILAVPFVTNKFFSVF